MTSKEIFPHVETDRFVRVDRCLAEAHTRLALLSETPGLEAQVLLAHILSQSKAWILAHPEAELSPAEEATYFTHLERLVTGTPLAYLLGHWEFYGLDFKVTPGVLIPRPETELLVETALDWLRCQPARRLAAEAGIGSGCIGVSLAVHCRDLTLFGGDLSRPALDVARVNCARHQVENRVQLFQADLLSCLSGSFDLLVANLPYIPTQTLENLAVTGREPIQALDGGPDGLAVIRRFLAETRQRLATGGLALAEIEAGQGPTAIEAAQEQFPDGAISVLKDLAGRDRLLRIKG